jgi:hypothetical protein
MMRPAATPEFSADARGATPDAGNAADPADAGDACGQNHGSTGRVVLLVALVAVLLTLSPGRLLTQEVTGPALKAAFLFNFVKFTTWPPDVLPEGAPLQMCVVNAQAVGSALSAAVQGRVVVGHAIRVAEPADTVALRGCHVLFVSGPRAAALKAVAVVRDAPVLTVSDLPAFTDEGGIAQFHLQQGQLRFAFALEAARAARLQISSKLLALARQP